MVSPTSNLHYSGPNTNQTCLSHCYCCCGFFVLFRGGSRLNMPLCGPERMSINTAERMSHESQTTSKHCSNDCLPNVSWGCPHLYIVLSTFDVITQMMTPNVNRAGEGHRDDRKLKEETDFHIGWAESPEHLFMQSRDYSV